MILSLFHHATHAHHLGRTVAALTLAAVSTVAIIGSHAAAPVARVTVARSVEAPAPAPAGTTADATTGTAPTDVAPGTQSVTHLGVTVPSRDEILAQCAAAGLTAECVSAGLR